jgi:23S rRNA C2498 (ribose-2'-O)-methylase RlmM
MYASARADRILALCRPGMESDCCAELVDVGTDTGVAGWSRAGDGWAELHPAAAGDLEHLAKVARALPPGGRLRAKQLYHDRDEVTVFASRHAGLE